MPAVSWSEAAAAVRDQLGDDERARLLRGVEKLRQDPHTPRSRPIGRERRVARVTEAVMAEYSFAGGQLVVAAARHYPTDMILEP